MHEDPPKPANWIDLEHARRDPAAVFRAPQEVVEAEGLTPDEKREILAQWELDARRLEGSEGEGMGGGEPALLRQVHLARAALDEPS